MISSQRLMRLALLVSLAGCNSSGTNVTTQQAAQFVPGTTTTADVTAKLGQPDSTQTLEDGSTIYSYRRIEGSSNPINYVPVVGLLAGSQSTRQNIVNFRFNAQGVYQSKNTSVSNSNTGSGLLSQ